MMEVKKGDRVKCTYVANEHYTLGHEYTISYVGANYIYMIVKGVKTRVPKDIFFLFFILQFKCTCGCSSVGSTYHSSWCDSLSNVGRVR